MWKTRYLLKIKGFQLFNSYFNVGNIQKSQSVSKSAWAVLAGLRFLLALVVVSAHARHAGGGWLVKLVMFGPFAAITGFLFISGFSIANSISMNEKGFYLRRIARVMPVHIATCLFFSLALMHFGEVHTSIGQIFTSPPIYQVVLNVFLLNGTLAIPVNGPSWSLACEVFFYCASPLLIFLITKKKHVLFCLFFVSSLLYFFHSTISSNTLPDEHHGIAAISIFWAWASGFYLYFNRDNLTARAIILLSGVFLLAKFDPEGGKYEFLTISLTAFILTNVDYIRIYNDKIIKFLNYLGDLSFPMFLSHFPLVVLLNGVYKIQNQTVIFIAIIILSNFLLFFIDRPCRKYISQLHCMDKSAKIIAFSFMLIYTLLCLLPTIK